MSSVGDVITIDSLEQQHLNALLDVLKEAKFTSFDHAVVLPMTYKHDVDRWVATLGSILRRVHP